MVRLVIAALVAGCGFSSTTEHIERIPTRDGVVLPILVVEPARPRGIVVLFPGAGGQLGLASGGIDHLADNLLVRTRGRFADDGFVTIVVDAPSDQVDDLDAFRISAEQAVDTSMLVSWAKQEWGLPVWLIGTSRGTVSAANVAAHGADIDGLVLIASVTAGDKVTLRDVAVDRIAVPTLFVHHVRDACNASPLGGAHEVASQFGVGVAWAEVNGGARPSGPACSAGAFHSFVGRDAQVVRTITQFIANGELTRFTL